MRVGLFANFEGAQKLFVQYLHHKTNVSRIPIPIKDIFPRKMQCDFYTDEVYTWISDRSLGRTVFVMWWTNTCRSHKVVTEQYFTFHSRNGRKRLEILQDFIIDNLRIMFFIIAARNGLLCDSNKTAGPCSHIWRIPSNEWGKLSTFVLFCCWVQLAHFLAARHAQAETFDGKYRLISTSFPLASKYLKISGLVPL